MRTRPVNFVAPLVVWAVGRVVAVAAVEAGEKVLGISVGFALEPAVVGFELEGSLSIAGGVGNVSVVPGEGDEKAVLGVAVSAAAESVVLVDSVVSGEVVFSVDGVTVEEGAPADTVVVGEGVAGDLLNAFVELTVDGSVLVVASVRLVGTVVSGETEVEEGIVEEVVVV